ncbi:uncharacterized protein BT62DRAFT_936069 [Guyanagaster necrorhizus]|uniref:Uncharacterized protein n=1 Tax=Guyanagaster necrorhizus TaxID=856835 RepID=A0A9P7VJZ0_9AGAR|nr:uncharacterized protein BT62DRAFT_936069 [Guyanagaster necrorhizus MCA 3950]KAG7442513.1 hypothetical protein BT62DRAFT_936069 [Guyanagaster necrorhizus MCA 3950]
MAFLGLRKWPTPVFKPLWPFITAGLVTIYGVSQIQDSAVRSPAYAEDPKNPYAARIAKEKAIAHH